MKKEIRVKVEKAVVMTLDDVLALLKIAKETQEATAAKPKKERKIK